MVGTLKNVQIFQKIKISKKNLELHIFQYLRAEMCRVTYKQYKHGKKTVDVSGN
jgi:hypothetical protein